MTRRLSRYALLVGGGTLAGWFITRWVVSGTGGGPGGPATRVSPLNLEPLAFGLGADLAGLALGLALGVGLAWFYARYLESL